MNKSEIFNILESMYGSFIDGSIIIDNSNEMDIRNEIKQKIPNTNIDVYVTIVQFGNMVIIRG